MKLPYVHFTTYEQLKNVSKLLVFLKIYSNSDLCRNLNYTEHFRGKKVISFVSLILIKLPEFSLMLNLHFQNKVKIFLDMNPRFHAF